MNKFRPQNSQSNRFLKLSLKKNRPKGIEETKKLNRSSDVIILDESSDGLKWDFPKPFQVSSSPKIYSPVVINDSSDSCEDSPKVTLVVKEPSMAGNVSFNCSKENVSMTETKESRPSIGGWSPAQSIICATPRHQTIPSTPKDVANESMEQCSLKKVQQSQKKLLDDLYGEVWKSIPTLFKTVSHNHSNFNGITKKLQFNDDDDDSEKENIKSIRRDLEINKQLYLTSSETKILQNNLENTEKKSKKKLYTEKIQSTPDVRKQKTVKNTRNASTTVKKTKGLSVTELVATMVSDFDTVTNKVEIVPNGNAKMNKSENILINDNNVNIKVKNVPAADVVEKKVKKLPAVEEVRKKLETVSVNSSLSLDNGVKRLSFMGSLADNVPSWRCDPSALQYHDHYTSLREPLTRRLYVEFNRAVFDDALDADMPLLWDTKLRTTAGTTTNRLIKNARGDQIRSSSIKLSCKVLDTPQRLRDTLIHELCHAATWLIDGELRAGHGPLWDKWAKRALRVFPELLKISRCHDLEIHFKYSYKCTKCGYSIQRHSKSIDVTKKCCGYCRGTFEVILNRKNKDGVIVSTPARKGGPNDFAKYVKENYASVKSGKSHAQVMKLLGEQFSAKKKPLGARNDD